MLCLHRSWYSGTSISGKVSVCQGNYKYNSNNYISSLPHLVCVNKPSKGIIQLQVFFDLQKHDVITEKDCKLILQVSGNKKNQYEVGDRRFKIKEKGPLHTNGPALESHVFFLGVLFRRKIISSKKILS